MDASELYAVFNGKPLADSELLSLAGVEEEQTLYILGRLLGGGKKRKKKTYTKPKKQKHKHKKIKLRVLKFYKVSLVMSDVWEQQVTERQPCRVEADDWRAGHSCGRAVAHAHLTACCLLSDPSTFATCRGTIHPAPHIPLLDGASNIPPLLPSPPTPTAPATHAGGRLRQGVPPAEAVPPVRPRHLHGHPL